MTFQVADRARWPRSGWRRPALCVLCVLCLLAGPAGCEEAGDEEACRTGEATGAVWFDLLPGRCGERGCIGQMFDVSHVGDATVMALTSPGPGEWRFDLWFVQDATSVGVTLRLPEGYEAPLSGGIRLEAQVSLSHNGWYEDSASLSLHDAEGQLWIKIGRRTLSAYESPPPRCHQHPSGCGWVGFPEMTVSHSPERIPIDPPVVLKQGDDIWVEAISPPGRWHGVVGQHWVYLDLSCTDIPPGWSSLSWLRVP